METCPDNRVFLDVVKDGRYEGLVVWLKLKGSPQGELLPLSREAAEALHEALGEALKD